MTTPTTMRIALICALLLTGCATTSGTGSASDPLQQIAQFATDDLTASLADAKAHNDQAAAMCYQGLLQIIPTLKPPAVPTVKGVFSALQVKRDVLAGGGGQATALLKQINLACAALVNDEIGTAARLGAIGAGVPGVGALLGQ